MKRLLGLVLGVVLFAAPRASATVTVTVLPSSDFNTNTTTMDAALGITGYNIDNFETTTLLSGLSITLSGGVATTTYTSLPNLFNGNICPGLTSGQAWDGTDTASNALGNQLNSCFTPTGLANLTTFNYAPGTTSFGIGLSNFQSTNPASLGGFSLTNHELFVNGVDMGSLESLAGANWSPGLVRNGYLRIDATGGGTITSVGVENLTASDFLMFDRLAVKGAAATTPEPASLLLLGSGLLGLAGAARRKLFA